MINRPGMGIYDINDGDGREMADANAEPYVKGSWASSRSIPRFSKECEEAVSLSSKHPKKVRKVK